MSKHIEIKGSDKYVTLDISLKFDSMDNMRITSSESKENLGILGKGLITFMDIKAKVRPKKLKNQGMPLEMSVQRTFQILLGSLTSYLIRVMRGGGPNMSIMTVTLSSKTGHEVYDES